MAGLKKKQRIQFVAVAGVLLVVATLLVVFAARDAFEFFRSPSQIATDPPYEGERFRLGGLVKEGSWVKGQTHSFVITDLEADFPVQYEGIVPDLFTEGQGTIVTGQIDGDVFVATEVLAKHDEEYLPKEVADTLKDQGVFRETLEN